MWQGNNRRKSSTGKGKLEISNSRAMGVIVLIALLFVFQVVTFTIHKIRKANLPQQGGQAEQPKQELVRFMFNPNTIPLDSLQMLGFTQRQAQSVLNYRNKGGKFRVKKDFSKLYVVDSAMYCSLEEYLLLPDSLVFSNTSVALSGHGGGQGRKMPEKKLSGRKMPEQQLRHERKSEKDVQKEHDDSGSAYGKKVEANRYVCNLNTADSAALVRLYGIGGYYARKILEYRERLGGSFVDKRQLLEIKGFSRERYEGIEKHIEVCKEDVKAFSILNADREALERHPYIGKYAARGIVLYLQLKGKDAYGGEVQLLEDLVREHIITQDNAGRLREYLLHL